LFFSKRASIFERSNYSRDGVVVGVLLNDKIEAHYLKTQLKELPIVRPLHALMRWQRIFYEPSAGKSGFHAGASGLAKTSEAQFA
jgi:hypothetical protein